MRKELASGAGRMQYWTLGLIGALILALLTGAFAVIAALLQ